MKKIPLLNIILTMLMFSQELTNSTQINISKIWSQEPLGWTYPIAINVPNIDIPENGLPVCVLLHGFGGNGENMQLQWVNFLQNHILISPTGYMNCWNISDEPSEAPDVEMINDLIEQLQTFDNVNPNRIRLIGSSNGSALANRIFIENSNPGIDIICAVISQLSEAQYHNNNFHYPSGTTGGNHEFDGYDNITSPLFGRRYLNIGNINDQTIPYEGGSAVGVNFLNSQEAIYIIARSQGYEGNQISEEGNQIGSSSVYEYSYLSNHVVHLKGDAGHGINSIQKEYIINYFSNLEGDINEDSYTNVQDIVLIVNLILNNEFNINADLNSDTSIDVIDIVILVNIILN